VRVADTIPVPFRFVCCLEMFFTHPTNPLDQIRVRGSGTLVSDRHVLTCGHNLLFQLPGFASAGRVAPARITVTPGRNGTATPFGEADADDMRVPPQWTASPNAEFDFGLITLDVPIGAEKQAALGGQPLGFWSCPRRGGGTRIRPHTIANLRNLEVNQAGYPADKCEDQPAVGSATAAQLAACGIDRIGTMMWRSNGHIVNPSPPTEPLSITYDMDSFHGDSGGPVWVRWQDFRNIVAVHTGGFPDPADPTRIIANMGVRITDAVLAQLRTWMRADGVSPNF
jgi:V8-like Glu-specific endopeptidase